MEYVGAYLETIGNGSYNTSTVMFVFKDSEKGDGTPVVVPVEMNLFDEEALQQASYIAISRESGQQLDMIIFAEFEEGFNEKDEYRVCFGCRDGFGNTIHRIYKITPDSIKLIESLPFNNIWTPPVGVKLNYDRFNDTTLVNVATNYAMMKNELLLANK